MAGLDDFFAKKDRKKPKGKKFTTTDEIAKKLEETGKKIEKAKKDNKPMNEGDEPQQHEDEDEWKVFEEEKKDYSGLKIGNLTVNDSLGAESDDERGMADNCSDNGESGEMGEKHTGPWKKPEQPPQPEPVVEVAPPPQPPPTTSAQPSSYKAPHLRNLPFVSPSPRLRSKNIAPDIHSEEYFPTLNSNKPPGTDPKRRRDEGSFEEVRNRGGSRGYTMQDAHPPSAKLSLGNKYGALSQDQS